LYKISRCHETFDESSGAVSRRNSIVSVSYLRLFYEICIEVFVSEGTASYIYLLGSGHIMYILKEYKDLYLYSQQGWEALNGKIQTFIHQNSQRGGHNSGTKHFFCCQNGNSGSSLEDL
jgi:hypothetical protein